MTTLEETITLTFGDSGENHVGMKTLGEKASQGGGFTLEDLTRTKVNFEAMGKTCELYDLSECAYLTKVTTETQKTTQLEFSAYVLVIRGGANVFGDLDEMKKELVSFEWDKEVLVY